MPGKQYRYWICTTPFDDVTIDQLEALTLTDFVDYIKGQLEQGERTGYKHWQWILYTREKYGKGGLINKLRQHAGNLYDSTNIEPTRSISVERYVWKEETRLGEMFVYGTKPIQINNKQDWDLIWNAAKERGAYAPEIPSALRVRHYRTLQNINKDNLNPRRDKTNKSYVFWGDTGTGKTHTAWTIAGWKAYPKISNTKYWDGYDPERYDVVIFDEFRGLIGIENILRWLDRYPCIIEYKFGATYIDFNQAFFTSNLNPVLWYPDIDAETRNALLRRLTIIEFRRLDDGSITYHHNDLTYTDILELYLLLNNNVNPLTWITN